MEKGAAQLLPLTLVVGRGGKVLFSHYGESLTDLPEDCNAMERVCSKLNLTAAAPESSEELETKLAEPELELEESTDAPEQDAPNLEASSEVLFPGQNVPEQEDVDKNSDTDHTQQIDLSGWLAPEEAEEAEEEESKPRWSKLVNLFADRDQDDED